MRKPFFRKQTSSWYVLIDGKQVNLGKDRKQAFREYHRLMAGRQDITPEVAPNCRTLQVLIPAAILSSKGVHHGEEIESQEEPYWTSYLQRRTEGGGRSDVVGRS